MTPFYAPQGFLSGSLGRALLQYKHHKYRLLRLYTGPYSPAPAYNRFSHHHHPTDLPRRTITTITVTASSKMADTEVPSSPESSYSEPSIAGSPVSAMADGLTPYERRDKVTAAEIAKIEADDTLDEAAKIDAVAKIQGWFRGDTTIIDAFLAGELDEATAVERLAAPIEEAYSTANHGTAFYREEMVARNQRKYHSKEKAYEMWGPEQDFPEPSPEAAALPTTEGQLWDLWYGILHAAKRLPWTPVDAPSAQDKLVSLVRGLQSRAEPPAPAPMTAALQRNWIWQPGRLWGPLVMLGPSAREVWNDACGCGAGWSGVERRAWTRVNGFVARLTRAGGLGPDFRSYGAWALADAFEGPPLDGRGSHRSTTRPVQLRLCLAVAAAWVLVAGPRMYAARARPEPVDVLCPDGSGRPVVVPVDARGKALPWLHRGDDYAYCTARWDFWRRRFEREAANEEELTEDVRELCARSAEVIKELISSSMPST
ncbi:hypothetical protein F4775DRAFT_597320 [Biscogniauxia sp. FL1348]|nr:hypothetical protein F4775DRAFT_597320 [Biscogniauxia sp. FL1348]